GGVARRHGGQVLPLVPHRTAADGAAHGVDVHGGVGAVACGGGGGDDDGGRAVHRHVAVVAAERPGDHTRPQVVVHGERLTVDGGGIQRRVRARGERD